MKKIKKVKNRSIRINKKKKIINKIEHRTNTILEIKV